MVALPISAMRGTVMPEDFGAVGNGMTDDTQAIRNAIIYVLDNPNLILLFGDTHYLVGTSVPDMGSIFTLNGSNGFTMRGRPHFIVRDTSKPGSEGGKQLYLFDIKMSDVDIDYIAVTGDAWTITDVNVADEKGVIACKVHAPTTGNLANHRFGTIKATNAWGGLLFDANNKDLGRSRNLSVGKLEVVNSVYGFNGANAPDDHDIAQISTDNVFRSYFVYGVTNGRANVFVGSAWTEGGVFSGGTCANIAVYAQVEQPLGNRVGDTRNIKAVIHNISPRPSCQISTICPSPTDAAQGHYNIDLEIFSTLAEGIKIYNGTAVGDVNDNLNNFLSPKRNIVVRANVSASTSAVSHTAYGRWADAEGLSLACSRFLDAPTAVQSAYFYSGWIVQDISYGYDIPNVVGVARRTDNSFMRVAAQEGGDLLIGSDAADLRLRADTGLFFFIGNAIKAYMSNSVLAPQTDNVMSTGTPTERWAGVYGATLFPGDGTVQWTSGHGTPEGNVTAAVGSLYTRTRLPSDIGTWPTLYVKETGTGNTGWVGK